MDDIADYRVLVEKGRAERNRGNRFAARELYADAASLLRDAASDPLALAHTVRHVADIDREMLAYPQSEAGYREALAIYRSRADRGDLDLANMLNGFSKLLVAMDKHVEARQLTMEARELYASLALDAGVKDCDGRFAAR